MLDAGVFPGGWAIPLQRGFGDTTPVLIGEPVEWDVEYRCIVLENSVLTYSPYSRWGRWIRRNEKWTVPEAEAEQLQGFCKRLLNETDLPPTVTMDVGRIAGRGWAVVEFNPVWSSGLYGCAANRMLPALRRACTKRRELNERDQRWVVAR